MTQCAILPQTSFRYAVKASNAGTHWWHSHVGMQRADGAFGALIVREPYHKLSAEIRKVYRADSYDHILFIQDWKHETGVTSFNSFHHSIGDNKPTNILINGKGINSSKEINREFNREFKIANFQVFSGKKQSRQRFRLINSGFLNCPSEISIDNHTLYVIASDGHYIEPVLVDSLVSYAGERFDFVINLDQPIGNYWIRVKGLMDCDERFHKAHQGAILHYNEARDDIPIGNLRYEHQRDGIQMNSLNRGPGRIDSVAISELTSLEPDETELVVEHTQYKFYVYFDFNKLSFPQFNDPKLYSIKQVAKPEEKFFGPQLNHITMEMPSEPFLVGRESNHEGQFCNSSSLMEQNVNCENQFCACNHVLQVRLNSTVEIILVDEGFTYDASHPFHLHG